MIYAIELELFDTEEGRKFVTTSKVASFDYESYAVEFAKGNDAIMLISDDGEILKQAMLDVE